MYVIDIETTGLSGIEYGDKIVEIGVCEITGGKIRTTYSNLVSHPDILDYSDSWVFQNTSLTPEEVKNNGTPEEDVISDLKELFTGEVMTSYNVPFDFGRFLLKSPYDLKVSIPFDIMEIATIVLSPDSPRWLRSQDAYRMACPEDPAGLKFKQTHRALDDAIMEAHILTHVLGISGGE